MEKRVRSPNYPALSLKEAVDKVGMLYKSNRQHPAPRQVVAKAIGYNSLNGASATAISALNKYGLLEGRGDDLRVSERAMKVLFPQSDDERNEALKEAAVEPRLFAELAERFPGGVENDELLKNYLLRQGFADSAVTFVLQAYRETSEFVQQARGSYNSPPVNGQGEPEMEAQPSTPTTEKASAPKASQSSAKPSDDTRVIHRFDFQNGGFVEIRVSRNVRAELALRVIDASMASMKAITELEAETQNESGPAFQAEEEKDE